MLAAPAKPPPFSERPLPVTQEETEARAGGVSVRVARLAGRLARVAGASVLFGVLRCFSLGDEDVKCGEHVCPLGTELGPDGYVKVRVLRG